MNALEELKEIAQAAGTEPLETVVPGLSMIRGDVPKHQLAALYRPVIGFTVQGTKHLSIGEKTTALRGPCYYVLPVHVPATATVQSARDGGEYISMGLEIHQGALQKLLRDLPEEDWPRTPGAFAACKLDEGMLDALARLARLTMTPRDIPALGPIYEREILYRVLTGPQGYYLRQIGMKESGFARITKTVKWLRDNFARAFEISDIAAESGMSVTTFHRQFKQATGLSPIQFQKQLRLLEARNLLAHEGYPVAGAAYEVGYQSPSQFSREYSRFFGVSPAKGAEEVRGRSKDEG